MANRHFAKLADVWKHLPLAEALSIEKPRRYWESHAGSAAYSMSGDAERRYGVLRFVEVVPALPRLASSRYFQHLHAMNESGSIETYPGSPLLAMLELGTNCSYVFCDRDPGSGTDLEAWSTRLGVDARVVASDGMTALHEELLATDDTSGVFAHVDPYDPQLPGPAGLSALDLAGALIRRGIGLMYWYGYDRPQHRAWALDELAARGTGSELWCGDVMIESQAEPNVRDDGDLGEATTPGTGFGIVLANVEQRSVVACAELGAALSTAYDAAPMPDGTPGRLDFTIATSRAP